MGLLISLVEYFFDAVYVIVLAGILLSWMHLFIGGPRARWLYHPFVRLIEDLAFRILRPFRRFLSQFPALRSLPIDFSPVLALLVIGLVRDLILRLLLRLIIP